MSSLKKEKEMIYSVEVRLGIFLLITFIVIWVISYVSASRSTPQPSIPAAQITIHNASSIEIVHGDTAKKQIIFTFDGGSGANSADSILMTLAKHHVKGTFFLTGKFVQANPAIVKRMADEGHEIFNHTLSHPRLTEVSDAEIIHQLNGMDEALRAVIASTTRPFFRPPYGARNDHVLEVAFKDGFQSVFWTVDAQDWKQSIGMTAQQVKDRILSNLNPGTIILMHVGDDITGRILDDVFTAIEGRGYKLVSLTQGI